MTSGSAPEGTALQACLRDLSGVLWRERVALDRLADHLVAGDPDADCDGIYHAISALELHRAISAREAAAELGLEGEPTLGALIEAAPPGWADVFASHRRALTDLVNEVTHLARRPFIDLSGRKPAREDEADLRVGAVRRHGVQRSLRDFLG